MDNYCESKDETSSQLVNNFRLLSKCYLKTYEISTKDLQKSLTPSRRYLLWSIAVLVCCVIYQGNIYYINATKNYITGVRCILPNNYFIWEATRPISNCKYCINVTRATILPNVTREEFKAYAYTSKPIVIKQAFKEWPAIKHFDFNFFKTLYETLDDSYRSVDEECQFLHFKSDFISIKDVFSMSEKRIKNSPGKKSWYVGWGNCHPQILKAMRKYYSKPHFLPEDCEIPSKDYVFMGYDMGATTHLDFINRLMWQGQIKGSKTWYLQPSPECENVCSSLSFAVEPGDGVLVDTRVWYHSTSITPGQFSLSIQSEYG